jgi:hypothetical protein
MFLDLEHFKDVNDEYVHGADLLRYQLNLDDLLDIKPHPQGRLTG